jgi:hypothetical protein
MGVMTALAIRYVANPFSGLWKRIMLSVEIIGYSRAAAHLAQLGFYEESKKCMMEVRKLKR